MGWQCWLALPGPQHSSLHTSWPIWSGGERTSILCVPTHRCAWHAYSPESEVANVWRNAIASVRKLRQPREPPDVGRLARCSLAPCQRFPLERLTSQMRVQCHVAGRWVKVPAAELGWSLTLGREGLSGLPYHQKLARRGFAEGWSIYPPSPIGVPLYVIRIGTDIPK